MFGLLRDLYRFRGFVLGSIRREVAAQYQGSVLGLGWVVLNPLAMILIYTLVFAEVMRSRLPGVESTFGYSIYLCAGLLPWTYLGEALTRLTSVFVAHGNLIKKATFPRICLPVIALGAAMINFAVIMALFLGFLVLTGGFPGWLILAIVPALLVQTALTLGLGVFLGTAHVFFRDVAQVLGVGLQFWFWLTPIVYPVSVLPDWARGIMAWNPAAILVGHYQSVLLYHRLPDLSAWGALCGVTLLSALLVALGLMLYRARAGEMSDEL